MRKCSFLGEGAFRGGVASHRPSVFGIIFRAWGGSGWKGPHVETVPGGMCLPERVTGGVAQGKHLSENVSLEMFHGACLSPGVSPYRGLSVAWHSRVISRPLPHLPARGNLGQGRLGRPDAVTVPDPPHFAPPPSPPPPPAAAAIPLASHSLPLHSSRRCRLPPPSPGTQPPTLQWTTPA